MTDANGKATFTFTDKDAVNNGVDTVTFRVFENQFDATAAATDNSTQIRYTTEGTGSDYVLTLDGLNASGVAYESSSVSVAPLTDTDAGAPGVDTAKGDEVVNLGIVGGDTGAPVTISVDNGAKILKNAEQRLSQGADSETNVMGSGDTFRVIGTKSGLVTVTVTTGGRTHTAQFTVAPHVTAGAARNVAVSGPAEAESGTLATFTAVVTDAFGNPVPNVTPADLNVQVTGPGALQDTGAATDADGKIALNVRLTDDAEGAVTIKVTGLPGTHQFGAAADQVTLNQVPADGAGLPASSNNAEATLTAVAPVPEKVDAELNVTGKGARVDRVKAKAIDEAAGAKATLWVKGKKVKAGVLNSNGDITFRVKDKNGKKATRYVVKIGATALTFSDRDATRVR